jgi:hypothetical protein
VSSIRKALKNLPKTLDETYERMLLNIDEEYGQEALNALLWLAFSERPLRLEEAAEAIVVNPQSNPPFDPEEKLPDPRNVLQILGSLAVVFSNDLVNDQQQLSGLKGVEVIKLAHFSVKEYLLSERILRGPASKFAASTIVTHRFIAESCVQYILYYCGSDSKALTSEDLVSFPLLQYACQFWYVHVKSIPLGDQDPINAIICRLFTSVSALSTWLQIHRPDIPTSKPFETVNGIAQPLYFASDIGLETVVQLLLRKGEEVDARNENGQAAIHRAAANGHTAVVLLLLDQGANLELEDVDGCTPLSHAAKMAMQH